MIVGAAADAISDLTTAPFRRVFWKNLGLTLLVLAALWAVGTKAIATFAASFAAAHPLDYPWYVDAFTTVAGILSGVLIFVAVAYLIAPITSLVASFFLDEIAGTVERTRYPADPPGVPAPFWPSLLAALRFTGLVILVNLAAFVLLLVPGVNLVAFLVGNGYLLGREYFELAAGRLVGHEHAPSLRAENGGRVFLAGLVIAGFLSIPILNLMTPLFATAFMVHLAKRTLARDLVRR